MKKIYTTLCAVLIALAFLPTQTAQAQVIRFFLLPIEQIGSSRGPEYLPWRFDDDLDSVPCLWSMKDYGNFNNTAIVAVDCETQVQVDDLASRADVFSIPANMDAAMTPAERNALTNYLEANFVPAQWLASDTWREATRTITGMYLFFQCTTARTGQDPLTAGLTLNTQFQNLPQNWQDAISGCYADLDYSVNYDANTTLRNLLKGAADQWGNRPILFGFVEL